MKKLIFIVFIFCFSSVYATTPTVDLKGLTVLHLNNFSQNSLMVTASYGSAGSNGLCRIIIRSNSGGDFKHLAESFKFTYRGFDEVYEIAPVITDYALMFKLKYGDFGHESITIESRDGKSIGENIAKFFGEDIVAIIPGTCFMHDSKVRT